LTKNHFANFQFYLDEVLKNHSNPFYDFEYENAEQEYLKSKKQQNCIQASRNMDK
jgi:hypothetical protein